MSYFMQPWGGVRVGRRPRLIAFRGIAPGQGLGVDPVVCGPGEQFDFTAMTCVTAGQAVTPMPTSVPIPPIPTVPSAPAKLPPPPSTPPPAAAAAATWQMTVLQVAPWLAGAAVVLGVVYVASGSR